MKAIIIKSRQVFILLCFQNSVEKASQNLQNMSDAFFGRLVRSENLVIKTDDLALALKKVSPDDIKGLSMEEGPTKFKLPGNLGNMGSGDINAKVLREQETVFL